MSRTKQVLSIISLLVIAVMILLIYKATEPKIKYDQTVNVDDSKLNDSIEYASEKKPCFSYDVEICKSIRYCITPKKNSDYLITIADHPGLDVIVIKQSKILRNSTVTAIKKDVKDGSVQYSYCFKKGNTYNIYIQNNNEEQLKSNIKIEQDNWVFAPFGAYAQYGKENVYYFNYPYLQKIRRKFTIASISGTYYEDERLDELSDEELLGLADILAISIYICAKSNGQSEEFRECFRTFLDDEQFLSDISKSKFNFYLVTKGKGRTYSVSYGMWDQQNYLPKYKDNIRVGKYEIYSEPIGKITKDTEFDWEKFIR